MQALSDTLAYELAYTQTLKIAWQLAEIADW